LFDSSKSSRGVFVSFFDLPILINNHFDYNIDLPILISNTIMITIRQ